MRERSQWKLFSIQRITFNPFTVPTKTHLIRQNLCALKLVDELPRPPCRLFVLSAVFECDCFRETPRYFTSVDAHARLTFIFNSSLALAVAKARVTP